MYQCIYVSSRMILVDAFQTPTLLWNPTICLINSVDGYPNVSERYSGYPNVGRMILVGGFKAEGIYVRLILVYARMILVDSVQIAAQCYHRRLSCFWQAGDVLLLLLLLYYVYYYYYY